MLTHAMILTAGLGTRLRPLTDRRAKPVIPVAGEPMIRRIVKWMAGHGVTDIVMNLHHRPETLTMVVGDGRDLGVRVRYSWEQPAILGSAGGPRLALPIVGAETFLLINGDTLTDVDLQQVADAHRSSRALVTLALVPNREHTRYGGVRLDDSGAVTGFVGRGPGARGSWHFIGVQAVAASVFDAVPAGTAASSIGGIYDQLLRTTPGAVRGFCGDWSFFDVGTPADYLRTSLAFSQSGVDAGRGSRIAASANVTASVLWEDVDIADDVTLGECIVTDGVQVPRGAVYQRAILVAGDDGLVVTPLEGVNHG